jgi:excinuclease ABC subunit C
MASSMLLEKVKSLPKVPGVYLYRDANNKIIYVGKAKSLKDRVSSYFVKNIELGTKTKSLVENINDMSYIEVQSELEALILEADLIKRYKPKFNISLKDDKSYKYIIIRKEQTSLGQFAVIEQGRISDIRGLESGKADIFGPFPDSTTVKDVIRGVRRIIPFRDCSPAKFEKYKRIGSPCLYGHIGLCPAPCNQKITESEYAKNIKYLNSILKGKGSQVVKNYKNLMMQNSKKENFEIAAHYRDLVKKYEYVSQRFKGSESYITNPNLIDDIRNKALLELKNNIPILSEVPNRIECFDIANLSGKAATASMVVSIGGKNINQEYRRFKIKTKDTPDDFWMIREALTRRFSRTRDKESWGLPDLLVIDGGKGQISIAIKVLQEKELNIPVIGLAKRFETIFYHQEGEFYEVNLPFDNEGLKHLMALRDEAHRFARRYHHLLRKKELTGTALS